MDVWRVRPSGGAPERLTEHGTAVNFLAPLDTRTAALRGARGRPIGTLAVGARRGAQGDSTREHGARAIHVCFGQSRRPACRRHRCQSHGQPVARAAARSVRPRSATCSRTRCRRRGRWPRASRDTFVCLLLVRPRDAAMGCGGSRTGRHPRSGRARTGRCPSRRRCRADGSRVAVIVRREGKRHLVDPCRRTARTHERWPHPSTLKERPARAPRTGRPMAAWIVTGGRDAQGPGLFKIPVDGGEPVRLVAGRAVNPVWSPDGNLIVYAGKFFTGQVELLGVRPDGTPVELPSVRARPGGYRFLPDGTGLVYLPFIPSLDFWLLDFATKKAASAHAPRQSRRSSAPSTSRLTGKPSSSTARERTRISS